MKVFIEGNVFSFHFPEDGQPRGRIITDVHALRRARKINDPQTITDLHKSHGANCDVKDFFRLLNVEIHGDEHSDPSGTKQAYLGKIIADVTRAGLGTAQEMETLCSPFLDAHSGRWRKFMDFDKWLTARMVQHFRNQLPRPDEDTLATHKEKRQIFDACFKQLPFFTKQLAYNYEPNIFLCDFPVDYIRGISNDRAGIFLSNKHLHDPLVLGEEILHYIDANILFYINHVHKNDGELDFIGEDVPSDHFSLQPTYMHAVDADIAGAQNNPLARRILELVSRKLNKADFFTRCAKGSEQRYFESLVDYLHMFNLVGYTALGEDPEIKRLCGGSMNEEHIMHKAFPNMTHCILIPSDGKAVAIGPDQLPVTVDKATLRDDAAFTPFLQLVQYRFSQADLERIPARYWAREDESDPIYDYVNDRSILPEEDTKIRRPTRSRGRTGIPNSR